MCGTGDGLAYGEFAHFVVCFGSVRRVINDAFVLCTVYWLDRGLQYSVTRDPYPPPPTVAVASTGSREYR
jgi:hypothetical protein